MKSLARWGSLPLLGLPLGSWALGLDEIELNSYLNQPLNAEIPYTATPEERTSLSVSLAPVDAFVQAGLEYPAFLSSIEFEIGQNVITVRSTEVIAEPFVTVLVRVSHARGTTQREYSVLLDPPLFLPAEVQAAPIAAPVVRAPEPAVAGGQVQRTPVTPQPAPGPQPQSPPQAQPQPGVSAQASGNYTVQGGDTLWGIANQVRPAGVSTNQAMISIFESNPGAFEGNINRLRRGSILRIPPATALSAVGATAATTEVQRQIDAWRNNVDTTPQLVLLPPSDQPAAGGGAASAADAASAGRVTALESEVTRLGSNLTDTAAELAEAERLLAVRSQELADLQQQLNDASATDTGAAPDVAPADDLGSEPLFVDDVEPAADEVPPAADEVEPVQASETTPPPIVAQPAEPSLVDRAKALADRGIELFTNRFVLMGGGAFILVLALLAFLRRRGGDADDVTGQWEALEAEIDEEADHAATARLRAHAQESDIVVVEGHDAEVTAEERQIDGTAEIEALDRGTAEIEALDRGTAEIESLDRGTAEVESLPEPGDDLLGLGDAFAEPDPTPAPEPAAPAAMSDQTLSSQTVINLDQADPIAEADFHMAYGLYDQAADLISKSLSADPGNRELKLKLLEVYFVWGNKELFLESANGLRDEIGQGGNPDWDKVVIMGKQICPDETMFAEATAGAAEVDLDLESSSSSAGLDFAFDAEEDDSVDLEFVDDPQAASGAVDDAMLDIGERTQAGLEAALFEGTDDEGEQTTPGAEIGDLDATMESPTVSTEPADFADAPTVETPTIEAPAPEKVEAGDTLEHVRSAAAGSGTIEMTAELEIDDLGLDIGDLGDLPQDIVDLPDDGLAASGDPADEPTIHPENVEPDEDLLSATGVTQVLDQRDTDIEHTATAIIGGQEAMMMAAPEIVDLEANGTSTEVLKQPASQFDPDPVQTEDNLDLNLDDVSSALEGADTVEQPMASGVGGLDLDVGADVTADDEPTGTEEVSPLDPQTMTEVGTKLDLARAYIDMGDPEGAKSILEEVLGEGDTGQRSEAQALIDALPG